MKKKIAMFLTIILVLCLIPAQIFGDIIKSVGCIWNFRYFRFVFIGLK